VLSVANQRYVQIEEEGDIEKIFEDEGEGE
jgi:hypothetical protein